MIIVQKRTLSLCQQWAFQCSGALVDLTSLTLRHTLVLFVKLTLRREPSLLWNVQWDNDDADKSFVQQTEKSELSVKAVVLHEWRKWCSQLFLVIRIHQAQAQLCRNQCNASVLIDVNYLAAVFINIFVLSSFIDLTCWCQHCWQRLWNSISKHAWGHTCQWVPCCLHVCSDAPERPHWACREAGLPLPPRGGRGGEAVPMAGRLREQNTCLRHPLLCVNIIHPQHFDDSTCILLNWM